MSNFTVALVTSPRTWLIIGLAWLCLVIILCITNVAPDAGVAVSVAAAVACYAIACRARRQEKEATLLDECNRDRIQSLPKGHRLIFSHLTSIGSFGLALAKLIVILAISLFISFALIYSYR